MFSFLFVFSLLNMQWTTRREKYIVHSAPQTELLLTGMHKNTRKRELNIAFKLLNQCEEWSLRWALTREVMSGIVSDVAMRRIAERWESVIDDLCLDLLYFITENVCLHTVGRTSIWYTADFAGFPYLQRM